MVRTIGIVSLKGGVGKTSVVAALGAALGGFDKKVLLVDGNLSAPNLGMHLKIVDPEITLHHVLGKESNIQDAVHKLNNFDVIPASIFNQGQVNPLTLKDKLKFLKQKYDVVLLDSSPSLNDETLAVMLASDGILVVTTPDYPTLSMTLKAVKSAMQRGIPIQGLILNKVNNKNFELSIQDIEKTIDLPVMAVIPHDIDVLKALSEFIPSTIHRPKSGASIEYKKLAATLIGEKYKSFSLKNFFRITPKRQEINREIYYERIFK